MTPEETLEFEKSLEKISEKAREFGLNFFDMRFEICPADIIYTFGSYGMPTRYAHWSFGKSFQKMKTQYDYNLSRIYELVINSDPCYAFFLDGNSLIQNKMVAAHVFAHSDFFKKNQWFRHTSRKMTETMSRNAERIKNYEFKYGKDEVEEFLDAAMALQEHIDPRYKIGRSKEKKLPGEKEPETRESPYDELWNLDVRKKKDKEKKESEHSKSPASPEKDILKFIALNSRNIEEWQRDIIFIVRDEMLYFWPQIETKIMNEGWATYWHIRIMREIDMTEDEAIEFAKMHAGVLQPSPMGINPYHLGLKIWEDIEKRWNNPTPKEQKKYGRPGGQGREKIFEIRETENDMSFIRNYLTKELVEKLDLYLFQKVYTKWQVVDTEWEAVREGLVTMLGNGGFPYLVVEDGNYNRNGELYIKHIHEDRDLDLYYMEKTLPHVYKLWNKPVHLETFIDGNHVLFSFDGNKVTKKSI